MKSFNPFLLTNIQEAKPTIKQRGIYIKEKMPVEKRYRKKHEIRNYKSYLGVNAMALARQTDFNLQRLKMSVLNKQKYTVLRKRGSKPNLRNSKSEYQIAVRSNSFVRMNSIHRESPRISIRIKPPVLVPYRVSNINDHELVPCQNHEDLARSVIYKKSSFKDNA